MLSRARRWPLLALLGYSFSVAPALATATVATAVLAGAVPVGITVGTGALVDALTSAIGKGTGTAATADCYRWVAVIAVLFLLTHLTDLARTGLGRALGQRVTGRLDERLMASASEPATIGHLEDPGYLSRLSRARGQGTIAMPAGEAVFGFSTKTSLWVTTIGSAALLVRLAWGVGLLVFTIFALISHRMIRNFRINATESAAQAGRLRRTAYLRDVPTTPEAAREVRIFGLTAFFRAAYAAEWRSTIAQIWTRRHEHRAFVVLVVMVVGSTAGAVFWYIGYRAATGSMSVGDLTTGALALRALLQVLNAGSDDIRIGFGTKAAEEALAFSAAPEPAEPAADSAGEWPSSDSGLAVAAVGFRYPGSDRDALQEVTLSVPAGLSLAVVGLNGAGKTTLARLLAGLDAPGTGSLSAGGVPIDERHRRLWQRQVVAVFQDFGRYELSLRDNIAFGALAHQDDLDGLREVARKAGLQDFVARLPHGWDTIMSSRYDGGVDASGGEWQRIAIARALFGLRTGARLLIMDEPAASLDARAEARLYDMFHELTEGVTTVVISHRFATVRKAERVVVMEHGQIIEDGTHEALLAADGRYAELFRLQASRFEEAPS